MLTQNDIRRILDDIQFKDWSFHLGCDSGQPCLWLRFTGPCSTTGSPQVWNGRRWLLSVRMSKSEIVQTAFKAVITAWEHEAREMFKYKGEAIFGPHIDCDRLAELCRREMPGISAARPADAATKGAPEIAPA
jgi:hypothetical protein